MMTNTMASDDVLPRELNDDVGHLVALALPHPYKPRRNPSFHAVFRLIFHVIVHSLGTIPKAQTINSSFHVPFHDFSNAHIPNPRP